MANWIKDGVPFRNPLRIGGRAVFNPTAEQLKAAGYAEEAIPVKKDKVVFTKLEIRRALREVGQEDLLDAALAANDQARKDWNDAQEIDLEDEVFKQALIDQGISERLVRWITIQIRRKQ